MAWERTTPRRSFPTRTARHILHRDGECQLRYDGCTGNADQADHIIGHADATAAGWHPDDIDDPTNGQAVCTHCHLIKTRAEQARGRKRAAPRLSRQRQAEQHPGLI